MIVRSGGLCRVRLRSGAELDVSSAGTGQAGAVVVAVRPERIAIVSESSGSNVLSGEVIGGEYHGATTSVVVGIGSDRVRLNTAAGRAPGPVIIHLPPDALRLLPAP